MLKRTVMLVGQWINYGVWMLGLNTLLDMTEARWPGNQSYLGVAALVTASVGLLIYFWKYFFEPLRAGLREIAASARQKK